MAGLIVPPIAAFAIPAVSFLIFFLSYTSQYLFYFIDPGPLSWNQAVWFNGFVLCIWWCYDRACTVDPGRKGWVERLTGPVSSNEADGGDPTTVPSVRWCKKCEAVKPPRAHHCRQCKRCIPKMDHHCPWTTNCVSHTNFPHFIRFVFYAVLSMSILAYHLFTRLLILWNNRHLPSYLGPPVWAMAHLLVLGAVNSITLFGLSVLLVRATYGLATNTTMIESWEIERHEALIERSRKAGGHVYANGGLKVRVEHQEFPYDIGIWKNLYQGMGTRNVLLWFLPFGPAPGIESAVAFEVNGFEDLSKVWPPPDPDKVPRAPRNAVPVPEFKVYGSPAEEKEAFRRRQQQDYERRRAKDSEYAARNSSGSDEGGHSEYDSEAEEGLDGEEGWTNTEGDRLRDYGVDEEAEALAEDDIPLGELLRRRRGARKG